MHRRKSYCVVCIANYCRSPVLEAFLKEKFKEYEFYSAGLAPMQTDSMDPRSIKFLEEHGINDIIHNPKQISKNMLSYFDYFIAVDPFVLSQLNTIYPKYMYKFFLATSHIDNVHLIDPYQMNDEDYMMVMNQIKTTSETIIL
ncbi:MAG: low molecular weight phosphatase family protein [Gammaproteobacteria bacterium]